MAAKGTLSKIEVGNKIIEVFGENAFWNGEGKEIRINTKENGEELQIKVALTVSKTAVEPGAADVIPGAKPLITPAIPVGNAPAFPESTGTGEKVEVSEAEKAAVADLMASLGL